MKVRPVEYLSEYNLEIIRQRHLNLNADDDSNDHLIDEMTQEEIAGCLVGWELGSDDWVDTILDAVADATNQNIDDIKSQIFSD
jgi:hypothetical protein